MKIGIFSKFSMAGGSEHRSVELCNSIRRYTEHTSHLLVRGNRLPQQLKDYLHKDVPVYLNMLKSDDGGDGSNADRFYEMDVVLIVNSDCRSWHKRELWECILKDKKTGQLKNHTRVDLSRIPQLIYLQNFNVGPLASLPTILEINPRIKIITTNKIFSDEIDEKDKFSKIRHLPRTILTSPIDPDSITQEKTPSDRIRIGQHSKGFSDKWNEDYPELIKRINSKYKDKITWDFMGMCGHVADKLKGIDNVTTRREFSKSIKDYLKEIDIFCFLPSWDRREPWCRVIAESMMSGCPIIATNKGGNIEQISSGRNGFLCDNLEDFENYIGCMIKNSSMIKTMGKESIELSKEFSSEYVIKKLIDFINL